MQETQQIDPKEVKEFKMNKIKRLSLLMQIFYYLGVYQILIITNNKQDKKWWNYKERFNPWNPLSYISVVLLVIYRVLEEAIKFIPTVWGEVLRAFKYR